MSLDVYVAFGQRRGTDPIHWILLVAPSGSDRYTWYHVTGGPTQGTGYTLMIQANKRVNSLGIASKELVGRIEEKDINKLKSSAQRVPLQRCQRWTCDLLEDIPAVVCFCLLLWMEEIGGKGLALLLNADPT
jgi:hypothetical protein